MSTSVSINQIQSSYLNVSELVPRMIFFAKKITILHAFIANNIRFYNYANGLINRTLNEKHFSFVFVRRLHFFIQHQKQTMELDRIYRVHYESNAHDFIVMRLSIAARSDRSDNVVGVCPSKRTRSQFAPSSRSGRTRLWPLNAATCRYIL